jgi:hypothetical protein
MRGLGIGLGKVLLKKESQSELFAKAHTFC